MLKTIDELNGFIDAHEACENGFFVRARTKKWSRNQLVAFAPDYYFWVKSFPAILKGLLGILKDEVTLSFVTEILYSELGSGCDDKVHFKLFARTLRALGLQESEINAGPRYEETAALVNGMRDLYKDSEVPCAIGAQYALERQAFPMINNLYQGFSHYRDLAARDAEYFSVHLVEEPKHLQLMGKCLVQYMSSTEDVKQVSAGALGCLNLIAAFWRRLLIEVCALE